MLDLISHKLFAEILDNVGEDALRENLLPLGQSSNLLEEQVESLGRGRHAV